jgi:hypothetical protein
MFCAVLACANDRKCPMKLYSKDGIEMMDVKSITLEDEKLVIKGKMMGAMAAIIHVKPEDIWEAFKLLPWSAKLRMPMLLLKGRRRSRMKQSS